MYITQGQSIYYVRYVAVAFSIFYVVLLLTGLSNASYPYMVPFLIAIIMSMDKFSVRITAITFVIANAIKVVTTLAGAEISNNERVYSDTANSNFADIKSNIELLSADVSKMLGLMEKIHKANINIVDSVSTLSASSEEISACTREAANMGNHNMDLLANFQLIMNGIAANIESLQNAEL